MKITIESTDTIVEVRGLTTRLWQGATESGVQVHCFIACIAVPIDQDQVDFERDLVGANVREMDPDELLAEVIVNSPLVRRSTGEH